MKSVMHERPGVYSSYDASTAVRGGRAVRTIGLASKSTVGSVNTVVRLASYAQGIAAFGEDAEGTAGMAALLRLLFQGGASVVAAVRVDGEDYEAAFAALQTDGDVQVVVCDSGDLDVQKALRTSLEDAAEARRERIAVVGMSGASVTGLIERAEELNCERMVLVGPDCLDSGGNAVSGVCAAAAVAAAAAVSRDPAVPLNGTKLPGLGGVSQDFSDNEIDLLVRGGVTPLEAVDGAVSPVRGITTRTSTGGVKDATWRELTTIFIVDDVIPSLRRSLRSRFSRTKNTLQTRGSIRAQTIVELENKLRAEIIEGYSDVSVSASEDDPSVCLVEFGFSVAHGLNQIYLTAHITI